MFFGHQENLNYKAEVFFKFFCNYKFCLLYFFVYCGAKFDFIRSLKSYIINKASKALGLIKKVAPKGLKRRIFTSFLSLNSHSKTECRGFDPFCPCQWKTAQPCGFEPFFFCGLILVHGLFCRILIPKTGADFPSGGIRLQRFRLLHHQ